VGGWHSLKLAGKKFLKMAGNYIPCPNQSRTDILYFLNLFSINVIEESSIPFIEPNGTKTTDVFLIARKSAHLKR
jgi:hypothetical protein